MLRRTIVGLVLLVLPRLAAADDTFAWQPFGYLRLQYIAVQNDPNVEFVGRDDGFELQNARLGARGTLGQRAAFLVSFDGAVDERTQANTPQGKLRVNLRDAVVDTQLSSTISARGGYWQTWIDPEALVPDLEREFVDHPIESRGMRSTEGWATPGLTPGRSLGVALRSDPPPDSDLGVGFEIAAQNGADEFSSNNDNDALALSAAVIARLPNDTWIVGGVRWNPRTVGELPLRHDETDVQGTVGAHASAGPVSISGGLIVQRTTYDTTPVSSQNAFGAHAQAMITVAAPLSVGYRFGILDPSSLLTTDRVIEHTVGAMYVVPSYRMRVQLQLTHVIEQAARELDNDRAQLALEVSL